MTVRIALAQFTSADTTEGNLQKIETAIESAAAGGALLVTFHELATTPYFCYEHRNTQRFELAEALPGPSSERICEAAAKHGMHVVLPMYENCAGERYNTAVFIDARGHIQGAYRKSHVPHSRGHSDGPGAEENFYFGPGDTGFQPWETDLGIKVGVLICYDRHFSEGARAYRSQNVDLVLVPTASYRGFIIDTLWEAELQVMAFQNTFYVAGINKVGPVIGVNPPASYPGRSVVVDPEGKILAQAGTREGVIFAEVDPAQRAAMERALDFYSHRRPDLYSAVAAPV